MTRIHELKIENFRGIRNFSQTFGDANLICLIGRGDSGKSTILDAISYVLSSSWNLTFFDSDFYECDTDTPIEIEATLIDLPENLILESKYGLHIRGLDKSTNEIKDDLEDDHEKALTIKLEIKKDLEPKWYVINTRQDSPISISAYDRAKLNVFMISDYIDRHFSWGKGTPLYSLLKQQDSADSEENNIIIESLREAKTKIDSYSFEKFKKITVTVKSKAAELGIDISNTSTSIDFKDITVKDGRVCLHDDKIPFRLKGKGSKRLISIAIQTALADKWGVILIDEIEQGLEPDRVQHLVNILKENNSGQIFMTTHSRDVIVELETSDIFIMKKYASKLISIESSLQGCIRKNPEAFFANRIIVCEGATEIGICCALNRFRTQKRKKNASFLGVRFADGTGSNIIDYCEGFKKSGFEVCLFCDSDDDGINNKKLELRNAGIKVVDCEQGNAIENQLFKDLPWDAIRELIVYEEKELLEEAVKDSVNSRCTESLTSNWQETDSATKREALGNTAKNMRWFKRIDRGKYLGTVVFKYFKEIQNTMLGKQLIDLSKWIGND
jgi:predicted ATP-dependent endonuclease of OLD family